MENVGVKNPVKNPIESLTPKVGVKKSVKKQVEVLSPTSYSQLWEKEEK